MQFKSLLFSLVAVASVFGQAPDPSINTPSGVTECLPVLLTFSGSQPPFVITVQPGGQAGAQPLATIGTTSSTSITWNVNLPAGTSCTLVIRDNVGRTNPSGEFTILPGNCAASSAAASGAGSTAAAGATTPVVATTPATVAATTPVATAAATTSAVVASVTQSVASLVSHASTAAATTTSKSGASSLQPMCLAGLMGLVGVAALM